MFKPDEAACLFAERFNMIGWIYKQEPIIFNRLVSKWEGPVSTHPDTHIHSHRPVLRVFPLDH